MKETPIKQMVKGEKRITLVMGRVLDYHLREGGGYTLQREVGDEFWLCVCVALLQLMGLREK
jgi:hypothetical protein